MKGKEHKIYMEDMISKIKDLEKKMDINFKKLSGLTESEVKRQLALKYVMNFFEDSLYLDEFLNESLLFENIAAFSCLLKEKPQLKAYADTVEDVVKEVKIELTVTHFDFFFKEAQQWAELLRPFNQDLDDGEFNIHKVTDTYHFLLTCYGKQQVEFVESDGEFSMDKMIFLYNSWLYNHSLQINSIIAFLAFLNRRLSITVGSENIVLYLDYIKKYNYVAQKTHENFVDTNEEFRSIKKNGPHAELMFQRVSKKLLANGIDLNTKFKGIYLM
ncbi:hypothetical protein [Bacillus wiedmannii]|uniref:hypothetical protein n=1 Tax=Bacillus wiedmannii TaxID=1890302 RepID=UPI000BF5958A|nr:hypothetical protein [Bacillus wiedmannii]PFY96969.1 hypothetical protein COL57_15840 [Bacillus wiedmannii]